MEKLLKTIRELIESGDSKKVLRAIAQTERLPDHLAHGFFLAARRKIAGLPGDATTGQDPSDALEAAIAETQRAGLNPQQVGDLIAVQLNQRTTLTETEYDVLTYLLRAAHASGARTSSPLLQNGKIQIEVLAHLLERDDEPRARRTLAKGLYDWRGRQRPDTVELVNVLPFLRPAIERHHRQSWSTYPATLAGNMLDSIRQASAAAGFFFFMMLLLIVVVIWSIVARPRATAQSVPAPVQADKPQPPADLKATLPPVLQDDRIKQRFNNATILILNDTDAISVLEVLTRHLETKITFAGSAFGTTPEGCDWLKTEDLALGGFQIGKEPPILVTFQSLPKGRIVRFVALPEKREILTVHYESTSWKPTRTTQDYLDESEGYMRIDRDDRARLSLQMAEAVAQTNPEKGRVHRRWGVLHAKQKASPEVIERDYRRARLWLPESEWQELPEAIRREYAFTATAKEIEAGMTTIVRPGIGGGE
jgi:hypothetical protein